MQYSWLPQERRQVRIREKPPLVISLQRYARLQANANKAAEQQRQESQKQRQLSEEQVRLGGEELLRRFAGRNLCATEQEQCRRDRLQQQQEEQLAKERAQEESIAVQREEQLRQKQRIEKAQQLLEQLRPGPRELHCAKLQSEVLRGIIAQRQLQTQFAAANEQQQALDRRIYSEQVLNGLEEAQLRQQQRSQQLGEHKRELLKSIEQRQLERNAEKAEQQELERLERQRNQLQVKQQLDKERTEQAAKVQQRRQYALASLEAAEHQRKQQQLLDKVELTLCEVHNEAKARLDNLKIDLAKQRVQRRLQRNAQLAQQLAPRLHYSASEDQRRHERQLAEMRRTHSVEQQERRQRREQSKAQRLATQQVEQQHAEAAKQQAKLEHSDDVARRLENERIHVQFKRQLRQEQLRRQHELRAQLDKQEQQRRDEQARPETNYNRLAQLECLREDARFVDYAHRLMVEAQTRGCPLQPFMRVLAQYKSANRIGAEVRVPRHLITKLTMGRRTKGDSPAAKQQRTSEEDEYNKRIAETLKKIEALVLEDAKPKDEIKNTVEEALQNSSEQA